MEKFALIILLLLLSLSLQATSIRGVPVDKIDPKLRSIINRSDEETIPVIIELYGPPSDQQIRDLEKHGFVVNRVFKLINSISGKIPAKNISRIAEYDWVKRIWLDSKKYALGKGEESSAYADKLPQDGKSNDRDRSSLFTFISVFILLPIALLILIIIVVYLIKH